jgi:thiol-disulfide isomerase/thioredoxin
MKHKYPVVLLGFVLVLAACGPVSSTPESMSATETHDAMMMDATPTHDGMMMDETPTEDMMMNETATEQAMSGSSMAAPDWFSAQLVDATSGDKFTIDGFGGKVVLVETMAVWCTNCLAQQHQIQALHDQLGMRDDLVTVSLDIDPSEDINYLRAFVNSNGFDWMYAIAGPDVAREIGQLYGDQFLNPPSTPMLIIDRQGQVHTLPFGIKNADELNNYLTPFLDEGM